MLPLRFQIMRTSYCVGMIHNVLPCSFTIREHIVQVGYTICYIGIVKILRGYCVCRIHSDSIKIMGADCVGRAQSVSLVVLR